MGGGGGGGVLRQYQSVAEIDPQNFIIVPTLCFIYVAHLTAESYFSHAETVHSLLLFDLSPFSTSRQVDLIP